MSIRDFKNFKNSSFENFNQYTDSVPLPNVMHVAQTLRQVGQLI